jgi:hypothetical protein
MHPFSSSTLEYLVKAGWYEGRKMPLVQWLQYRACLLNEGYAWFPAVADFLEEFGGLTIGFGRRERMETLKLDAFKAAQNRWFPDYYALRIGKTQFCVIGLLYTDHLLLFMDDTGNVYGGFDEFLCFVGNNGADAIEALCSNKTLPEIA